MNNPDKGSAKAEPDSPVDVWTSYASEELNIGSIVVWSDGSVDLDSAIPQPVLSLPAARYLLQQLRVAIEKATPHHKE